MSSADFAPYVALLGRGPGRSRDLTRTEAGAAFGAILAGTPDRAQIGAFLMLLRYRGETVETLCGLLDACRAVMDPVEAAVALDWPSYAGGRSRVAPWFVLAALALARAGVPVLLHGQHDFASGLRVDTALAALGLAAAADAKGAAAAVRRCGFAYLPLAALSPPLEALFRLRSLFGLRSPVNTVARLLDPARAVGGVDGVFHPAYVARHLGVAEAFGRPSLCVFKGGGGEAERNPDKPCTVARVQAGFGRDSPGFASWPGGDDWPGAPGALEFAAIWQQGVAPARVLAVIQATIAVGLVAAGRAETPAAADALAPGIWRERGGAVVKGAATGGTLQMVARRAGVSIATASRVLNGSGQVSPDTAARVRAAMAETGYIPNLMAGSLASSRSRLVAVVVPEIGQSQFAPTIQAMTDTLWEQGFHVLLALSGAQDQHLASVVESLLGRRPDGMILTGTVTSAALRAQLIRQGMPVIETWDLTAEPIDAVIGFSHEAIGRALAVHAESRGYRAPLLLFANSVRAYARRYGFCRYWMERGRAEPPHLTVPMPSNFQHGRRAFAEALARGMRPDCVLCSSDWAAHGVMVEAERRGMVVADDLAVIGFGDQPFASETEPGLTSVRIDGAEIGRRAAEYLIARIQGAAPTGRVIDIGFTIIARASG